MEGTMEGTMEESTIRELFEGLMYGLKQDKPEERSELARRYAITITELEKVMAYYTVYIDGKTE